MGKKDIGKRQDDIELAINYLEDGAINSAYHILKKYIKKEGGEKWT